MTHNPDPSQNIDAIADTPDAPTIPPLFELTDLVRQISLEEQGKRASPSDFCRTTKQDGSWVTEVDQRTQHHICTALHQRWPQYGFIGEEMSHAEQVAACDQSGAGYWVLDPLDGTTNFTAGFLFYGVSLALVVGGRSQLGVVFDPVRNECFAAQLGGGAYLNKKRLAPPPPTQPSPPLADCIAIIDFKRLVGDLAAQLVRSPPYRSQRNLGSSVLEWCWLAAGRAQLYLHGGQKLWDFAAGSLILNEAGGAAISLSGQPLDCAKLRKRSVVAATDPDLLIRWNRWINSNSMASRASPL